MSMASLTFLSVFLDELQVGPPLRGGERTTDGVGGVVVAGVEEYDVDVLVDVCIGVSGQAVGLILLPG